MSLNKQKTLEKKAVKPSAGDRLWSLITFLPYSLPAAIAMFSIVAMSLLLIGELKNIFVWPIGLILGLAVFVYVNKIFSRKVTIINREFKVVGLIVVLFLCGWTLVNAHFNSEDVFTYRDPSVYAVTNEWVAHHTSLEINQPVIYDNNLVSEDSAGFSSIHGAPSRIYPLGQHMLPLLVGLTNRIVGSSRALDMNIVIAAVSILAVYGLAALITKPRWALLSAVALSMCLPMLYFARDMYTEPLTMLYIFGGLSLSLASLKYRLPRMMWLLSGFTVGAAAMVRTDAFIPFFAIGIWILMILTAVNKSQLPIALKNFAVLSLGIVFPAILGLLDLMVLSKATYADSKAALWHLQLLGLTCFIIAVIYIFTLFLKPGFIKNIIAKIRPHSTKIVIALTFLIIAIIVSRPYWGHQNMVYTTSYIAGREAIIANPGETRPEILGTQLLWYLGPVTLILGILGLVYSANNQIRQKNLSNLLPIIVIALGALFYLSILTITPDQIWASRRLLPIVIPGLIIYASFYAGHISGGLLNGRKKEFAAACFLSLFILFGSVYGSRNFISSATLGGQLTQIESVCASLPSNSILLWAGNMRFEGPMPTKAYCGRESMGLLEADKANLKKVYADSTAKGFRPLIAISTTDLVYFSYKYGDLTEVSSLKTKDIEKTFGKPPSKTVKNERTIMLGDILPNGGIKPLHN